MSIYLNRDEIKNIDSTKIQQKILDAISKYVKEIGSTAEAVEIDIYPASEAPVFTKESGFLKMVGTFKGPSNLAEDHDQYLVEENE